MNVECTRLSNGLTIVTETMPGLESVALGVWVKSGSRNETAEEHGIAHLLEHMAFKGTRKRSARADRGGDRERRRRAQRLDVDRNHLLLRPRAEGRRAACRRHPGRHPDGIAVRRRRTPSRAERRPSGDRRRQRHAGRRRLRPLLRGRPTATRRSGARSSARRKRSRPSRRDSCAAISTGTTRPTA